MKTPFYRKTWFIRGIIVIVIGIFCTIYSQWHLENLGERFPELSQDADQLKLDIINNDTGLPKTKTKEEVEAISGARIAYQRSKMTIYFGYLLVLVGIGLMVLSRAERDVPSIEDLDDDDEASTQT